MPPLIPIIIGAAFAASGVGGIILGGISALTIGITGLGASLILGGLSRLLLPKFPSLAAFTQEARGRTVTARQPVAPWRVIYGEIRVGGVITFLHVTGTNKEFLHMVITLSGHEVDEIGLMYFDGVLVPVDGSGDATGFFLNHVHREINLGTDTQTAFPGLLADAPTKWTANHRQQGRAGIYVRLKFNPDKFPGNIPNITFDVKGKKLYDPRTQSSIAAAPTGADRTANVVTITTTAAHGLAVNDRARVDGVTDDSFNGDFDIDTVPSATTFTYAQTAANATSGSGTAGKVAHSHNAALCFSEYLLDTDYGVGVELPRINNPAWVAAANLSEEQVALAGGGFEDRYTCNGSFLVSQRMSDIMLALLSAMGGTSVYSGGFWFIYGAAWRGPTLTFDEGDLRGPIQVQARTGRRSLFNAVKGIYVSAANNWQPSDFPPVTNSTYETEDGGTRIFKDIQLPYTISSATAQRLAKIELERARRQKTVKARFGPTALQAQPPDVIQFSVSRFSWVSKTFEIVNEQLILDQDEDGTPRQENLLTMRESDSTVYDWAAEESAPTVPGTPDLPDPTTVAAPTALVLSSFSITRTDGIRITFLKVEWTAPADELVTNGGKIEIEFKKNADPTWIAVAPVVGSAVEQIIPNVDDDVAYDVRIRSVNILGAKSVYVQQLNFTVIGIGSLVADDAANGAIAFLGTVEYRKGQDPSNNAVPTGLSSALRHDGSVDVTLSWSTYVQGTVKAWALLIYLRPDGTLPTTADYFGMVGIDATAIRLVGLNPSTTYSFGIAAVRMLESGQVRTLISSPTSAPDWRGVTFGEGSAGTGFFLRGIYVPDQFNGAANVGEIDFDPVISGEDYVIFHPDGTVFSVTNAQRSRMSQACLESDTGRRYIIFSKDLVNSQRSLAAFQDSHILVVRWNGGAWEYDNNTAFVAFTPVDTDIAIFEVDRSGSGWAGKPTRFVGKELVSHALTDLAAGETLGKSVEFLRNPNFESGDRDWTKGADWTIPNDPANAYDGSFVGKWAGTTDSKIQNTIFIPVQPNERVFATCMIKRTAGTGGGRIVIRWLDSAKSTLSIVVGDTVTSAGYAISRKVATAPASAFFARVEAGSVAPFSGTTIFVDKFHAGFFPIDLGDVPDGGGFGRTTPDEVLGAGRGFDAIRTDLTYADPSLFHKSAVRKEATAIVGAGTQSSSFVTVDSFTRKLSPGTTKFLCTLECIITNPGTNWTGKARIKIGAALSAEVVVNDPATSGSAAVSVTGLTGDTTVTVEVQAERTFFLGGTPSVTARFTQTTPDDDDTSHWGI